MDRLNKSGTFSTNAQCYDWRKTAHQHQNHILTVKHDGLGLHCCLRAWMLCGHWGNNEFKAVSKHCTGECKGSKSMTSSWRDVGWWMQQDNDPKHTSKSSKELCFQWPSQSSDLNPNEMLWHNLKRIVHVRHPWYSDAYLIFSYRKCVVQG